MGPVTDQGDRERFYRAILHQYLFGQWIVTRVWGGRCVSAGRCKHILVDTYENDLEKLKRIDKTRATHLYRRAEREGESPFTLIAE